MSRAPLSLTSKSEVVSVRLTTDVLQRMREAARATDRSLGGMLRHAVRTYAEQQATADTPTDAVAAGDR